MANPLGRPPLPAEQLKTRQFRIANSDYSALRILGNGNATEGLRMAIAIAFYKAVINKDESK